MTHQSTARARAKSPSIRSAAGLLALAACLCGPSAILAALPPASDALTEGSAGAWGAAADSATASVFNDSARVRVGGQSLRLETTAPFDCRIWAPSAQNAQWDVAGSGGPAFWLYAENPSPFGFQENSPWVRLATDNNNYIDYRADFSAANDARGQWVRVAIPLAGNDDWQRSVVGSPNLGNINWIEIHADTWDAGFTLWIDDFGFTTPTPPPQGLTAQAGNGSVTLNWQKFDDITAQFSHYAIYRAAAAFDSTVDMTPMATIPDINTTTFTDNTAVNGTAYYYAVTAVFAGGGETTGVESVGPRTPNDDNDLQVVCIARTPRYPRYDPIYSYEAITEPSGFGPYIYSAATGLGSGQNANTQRWPAIGQNVIYTATIRNRGTNPWTTPVTCTWRKDGQIIGQPVLTTTPGPGQTVTKEITVLWDDQAHDISFTLETTDSRPANNTFVINTKSVAFLSYIDQTYYDRFRGDTTNYPNAATDDFIDWLNRHMARFNQLFAEAGTAKRVHFDVLRVLADAAPDPSLSTSYFAVFPKRYRAGDGSLRLSGYYHADDDIDYGLLHEMGHQLGLIDIYRMDVSAESNLVSGQGYAPLPDLMHGVSPLISPHSAGAMTLWLDKAHGYYGQYLYAIPAQVRLKLLGADGQPLAGAVVKMYQKCERPGLGEVITTQIKAQGTTDAGGEWLLPNVTIDPAKVPTTFAGDTLHDNPFGYVAVVGTNGVLHFRVEHNGGIDYCWLDITECNIAWFEGHTDSATFERQLSLGGSIQRIPPPELTELNANDWSAWAEGSDSARTFVQDDANRKLVGGGSIKFVTDGGFDTYLRYPRSFTAIWNLTAAQTMRISFYAENPNIGFQGGSPWIRLKDAEGNYFQYQYYAGGGPSDLLNQARNQWRSYEIPVHAPADEQNGWRRTASGAADLTRIQYVEIHSDTWGGGFNLWVDGLAFEPRPARADLDNDGDVDGGDIEVFVGCVTGPAIAPPATDCQTADFDGDSDVDQTDFATLQRCYGGPGGQSPSGCESD